MIKKITTFIILLSPKIAQAAAELPNPVKADSIPELISYAIKGLLGIVGALSLFFLVWGGIVWMTSSGNAERIKKGRDTIVWAIFGLMAIFLSYALIKLVVVALER